MLLALAFVWLAPSALAAKPHYPEITVDVRTEQDCYPMRDGQEPVDRLVLAEVDAAVLAASLRCVSPHARYYLRYDAELVAFVDTDGLVRTSHARSHAKNRDAVHVGKDKLARLRDDRAAAKGDPSGLFAVRTGIHHVKKRLREDRRLASWHGFFGRVARITGRDDGRLDDPRRTAPSGEQPTPE